MIHFFIVALTFILFEIFIVKKNHSVYILYTDLLKTVFINTLEMHYYVL